MFRNQDQSLVNKKINGVTFSEMKKIYNAIVDDDKQALEEALKPLGNINFSFEFYDDNLQPMNWSSDIQQQSIRTFKTLLHFATQVGRTNSVELLIRKNANVNQYSFSNSALTDALFTPLHELCCAPVLEDERAHYKQCAEILLANGADLNATLYDKESEQSAYHLCMGIRQLRVKKSDSKFDFDSYCVPYHSRSQVADIIKPVVKKYWDKQMQVSFRRNFGLFLGAEQQNTSESNIQSKPTFN